MDNITIDGMEEMKFRRSIESLLRQGRVDDAVTRLRTLLEGYAGEGKVLPERFLTVTSNDVHLEGWDQIAEKLKQYDRPEVPMSAISIDILDPQGVGARPDENGRLSPVIETNYFSDSSYPFSEADRDDLLNGYSSFGCEWQGDFENVDSTISVEGIDDLYGATVMLENKVASSQKVQKEEIEAGSIGSCFVAALIHQAIRDTARDKGLPRPICLLVGNNEAYPFFDAPALTVDEYYEAGHSAPAAAQPSAARRDYDFDDEELEEADAGETAGFESLISVSAKRNQKTPVLMLDPAEADQFDSFEMPIATSGLGYDRKHIMPSLELGSDSHAGEFAAPGAASPQWQEPEPQDWNYQEQAEPGYEDQWSEAESPEWQPSASEGFENLQQPGQVDFGTFRQPEPGTPEDEEEEFAPARIDFGAYRQPEPEAPQWNAAQPEAPEDEEEEFAPARIDFGAYRQPEAETPQWDASEPEAPAQEPEFEPEPIELSAFEQAEPEAPAQEPEFEPEPVDLAAFEQAEPEAPAQEPEFEPEPVDLSAFEQTEPEWPEEEEEVGPTTIDFGTFSRFDPELPEDEGEEFAAAPIDFGAYRQPEPETPQWDALETASGESPLEPEEEDEFEPASSDFGTYRQPEMESPGWSGEDEYRAPGGWNDDVPAQNEPEYAYADDAATEEEYEFNDNAFASLDSARFQGREKAASQVWVQTYDLSASDEAGDNLGWSDAGPDVQEQWQPQEQQSGGHSIRRRAAELASERGHAGYEPDEAGRSRSLIWIIISPFGWLRRRRSGR